MLIALPVLKSFGLNVSSTVLLSAMAAFAILEKELQGKQYLVNDTFSAADISVGAPAEEQNWLCSVAYVVHYSYISCLC